MGEPVNFYPCSFFDSQTMGAILVTVHRLTTLLIYLFVINFCQKDGLHKRHKPVQAASSQRLHTCTNYTYEYKTKQTTAKTKLAQIINRIKIYKQKNVSI